MFDNYCLKLFTCRFIQFFSVIRQTLQSITKKSLAQVKQLKNRKNQQLCLLLPKDRKSINELGFEQLRRNKHINRVSVANQVLHLSLSKISVSDQQTPQKRQQRHKKTRKKRRITLKKVKSPKEDKSQQIRFLYSFCRCCIDVAW